MGTYTITNGTLISTNNITSIGHSGGRGVLNVGGDASVETTTLFLGENGGIGTVNFDDGVVSCNGSTLVGFSLNSYGIFNQNGGTFSAQGLLYVGYNGNGAYIQSGGMNRLLGVVIGANNRPSTQGTYEITGGWLQVSNYIHVGANSEGQLIIGGDGIVNANGGVTLAAGSTGTGTLTMTGGVLNTTFIRGGSGSASATFNGGTIVATNVTDGANFISWLDNVMYGPGGLTLDTAGYNVTMATASGANVTAAAGSTFTKTGSGTLTVAAVPPVGNMVVSNGTLALSATCDNASSATAPVERTLELASGATLAVGSGNTLTQPAVSTSGTLASGNLVVTEQINVTVGQSMTVASGATLNLSNARVELMDPENLTEPFDFAVATDGGTIVGVPDGSTLPEGWMVENDGGRRVCIVRIRPLHTVTFDLGEHGIRAGGGELMQTVTNGCAAVAPEVRAIEGYDFDGWDADFGCIVSNATVMAKYVPIARPVSVDNLNINI